MPSLTPAPGPAASEDDPGPAGPARPGRIAAGLGVLGLVVAAGLAGWVLAGPPGDATAIVPPPCPATFPPEGPAAGASGAGWERGVPDRLVPMPLPQPRGPVSVRLCDYRQGRDGGTETVLDRQVVLDPVRTAALAATLNTPGPQVVASPARPAGCTAGTRTAVLAFRYTEGAVLVQVPGGPCDLVETGARAETGRGDVVRFVTRTLDDAAA